MKTMLSVKVIPMLAAVVLAPVAILAQASVEQKTLTGIVSDAMCGATHMMKDKPAAECLRLLRQARNQVRACRRQEGLHA